jgi:hypothetical protein
MINILLNRTNASKEEAKNILNTIIDSFKEIENKEEKNKKIKDAILNYKKSNIEEALKKENNNENNEKRKRGRPKKKNN